jgi:hypothetical protein
MEKAKICKAMRKLLLLLQNAEKHNLSDLWKCLKTMRQPLRYLPQVDISLHVRGALNFPFVPSQANVLGLYSKSLQVLQVKSVLCF